MDMTNILRLTFLVLIISILQGCVNAAVTGAQVVYDRHNLQKSLTDHYITMRANRSIYIDTDKFKNSNVTVSTFHQVVLLAGQVPDSKMRDDIEQKIRKIHGPREVHNLITASKQTTTMTRMRDAWITTKIKAKLIAANDVDPSQVKVITENGIVYLMGIVAPEEANVAVRIARTTTGVQHVIKIFEYLRISKV